MGAEPYLGSIQIFGFNFAPRGYAFCDGRLMSITQYSALFSLLGTQYGGNGQTNLASPNLQGRTPAGATGTLPQGSVVGSGAVTLTVD